MSLSAPAHAEQPLLTRSETSEPPLHGPAQAIPHVSAVEFPRDEGWHNHLPLTQISAPSLRKMEWYYANAHLVGQSGHHYVAMVAYFAQGLRLMSLTRFERDGRRRTHHHSAPGLGLLRATSSRMDMEFVHLDGRDRWRRTGTEHAGEVGHTIALEASAGPRNMGLRLQMTSEKPTYRAGNRGCLPFAEKGWFHYYSITRMSVLGTVTYVDRDGPHEDVVRGLGWFDHQWGPFHVTPFRNPGIFESYEWFGLQLSDGSDLLLTTVWDPDGHTLDRDAYGGAALIDPRGKCVQRVGQRQIMRNGFHRDPKTGAVYSGSWRVRIPKWDCDLEIRPRAADQMVTVAPPPPRLFRNPLTLGLQSLTNYLGSFWEGSCTVTGTLGGRQVTGTAFAELIKRYNMPKVCIESPLVTRDDVLVLRWRLKHADPTVAFRYRVQIFDTRHRVLFEMQDTDISVMAIPTSRLRVPRCQVVVVAHSKDWVLKGQASRVVDMRNDKME